MDKSSSKFLFYIRKRIALKPAETLESDGHYLSVIGHSRRKRRILRRKRSKITCNYWPTSDMVLTTFGQIMGQKWPKTAKTNACDSPEEGCSNLHDKPQRS